MALYYSASTGGFYDDEINIVIPNDRQPISEALHTSLLLAQAQGKLIQPNESGMPVAVDPPAPPPQTVISARDFMDRFTTGEQGALASAAPSNPDLLIWMLKMVAGTVDLTAATTITAMTLLVSLGLITADRKTAILTP